MDVSQAFKCLSEASDEAIYKYDKVDVILRVSQRLAKAVSISPYASSHHVSNVFGSLATNSINAQNLPFPQPTFHGIARSPHHTPSLGSQATDNVNLVQRNVPFASNLSNQTPVIHERPAQFTLAKAISRDISWLWNLRKKDVSRTIGENRGDHPDARVNDITRVDGLPKPTKEENLIVRTAQRSLALQFNKYEREIMSIDTLRKNPRLMDIHIALHSQLDEKGKKALLIPGRKGLVRTFVKQCICPESHRHFDLVVSSTNAGIKQLSLELELDHRWPTINPKALSAVTSMIKDIFKSLTLSNITDFITELSQLSAFTVLDENSGEKSHMHIFDIIDEVSPWYELFQESYDQQVDTLNEGAPSRSNTPDSSLSEDTTCDLTEQNNAALLDRLDCNLPVAPQSNTSAMQGSYPALSEPSTSNLLSAPNRQNRQTRIVFPPNEQDRMALPAQPLPAQQMPSARAPQSNAFVIEPSTSNLPSIPDRQYQTQMVFSPNGQDRTQLPTRPSIAQQMPRIQTLQSQHDGSSSAASSQSRSDIEVDDQSSTSTDLTEDHGIEPYTKRPRLDHRAVRPCPLETAIFQYGPSLGPQAPNPPANFAHRQGALSENDRYEHHSANTSQFDGTRGETPSTSKGYSPTGHASHSVTMSDETHAPLSPRSDQCHVEQNASQTSNSPPVPRAGLPANPRYDHIPLSLPNWSVNNLERLWKPANYDESHFQRLHALRLPRPEFTQYNHPFRATTQIEKQQIGNAPPPTGYSSLAADPNLHAAIPQASGVQLTVSSFGPQSVSTSSKPSMDEGIEALSTSSPSTQNNPCEVSIHAGTTGDINSTLTLPTAESFPDFHTQLDLPDDSPNFYTNLDLPDNSPNFYTLLDLPTPPDEYLGHY